MNYGFISYNLLFWEDTYKWAIPRVSGHWNKKRSVSLDLIIRFITNLMPQIFINDIGYSYSIEKNNHFQWLLLDLRPSLKLHVWDWGQQISLKCKLHKTRLIFLLTNFTKRPRINTFPYFRSHLRYHAITRGEKTSGSSLDKM